MDLRNANIQRLEQQTFDVLIVGGGINGAVCAAELSARGAKVALIDARDFAGLTSQQSSNLVWGGIKYMEGYEFGLVYGLCRSRNELMRRFPSVVKEIRFLTTVSSALKVKRWIFWLGAWFYWLLGRGFTRPPRLLSRKRIRMLESVIDVSDSAGGVEYSDAYLFDNDARFVFNFIRTAINAGCCATNYVELQSAQFGGQEGWRIGAKDLSNDRSFEIKTRVLINAGGACVDRLNDLSGIQTSYRHALSKGVHLIVPRITESQKVLAFFADDGRLFFAIPMANRTCIGTTDTPVEHADTGVSAEDRQFILDNINKRLQLNSPLTESDIIAERCGVRPLAVLRGESSQGDFLQLSRKHIIETDTAQAQISIFGGKLTDCLNVAAEVGARVCELGVALQILRQPWHGEPDATSKSAFIVRAQALQLGKVCASDTGETLIERLWRRYGCHAEKVLDIIEKDRDSVHEAIADTGLRWCEVDYMCEHEMLVELDDLLRRRSKLELIVDLHAIERRAELQALCKRLFGKQAEEKLQRFLQINKDDPKESDQ